MVFTITLITVFAAQVALYRFISRKVAERRAIKRRLASLVYEQPKARIRPHFGINRPGEN